MHRIGALLAFFVTAENGLDESARQVSKQDGFGP
jgi:hypothetical protein